MTSCLYLQTLMKKTYYCSASPVWKSYATAPKNSSISSRDCKEERLKFSCCSLLHWTVKIWQKWLKTGNRSRAYLLRSICSCKWSFWQRSTSSVSEPKITASLNIIQSRPGVIPSVSSKRLNLKENDHRCRHFFSQRISWKFWKRN